MSKSKIVKFEFQFEGKSIRVVTTKNGEPTWIANDACKILGLSNTTEDFQAKLFAGIGGAMLQLNLVEESEVCPVCGAKLRSATSAGRDWRSNMKITVEFELPSEVEDGNVTNTVVAIAKSVPGMPTIVCFHDVVMTYKPNKKLG